MPRQNSGKPPVLFNREVDREIPDQLVSFWRGGDGRTKWNPLLRRPFEPAEKAALEIRIAELECGTAPFDDCDRNRLKIEIDGMLGGYTTMRRADRESAEVLSASYLWVVQDYPAWAIRAVCRSIRTGKVGNPSFCPNEAEFARLIAERVQPFAERLRITKELLQAPIDADGLHQ